MLVVFFVELICHFHSKNVPFTYSKTIDWAGHDFIHTFTILLFHTFTILLLFHTVTHYDDDGKWNLNKRKKMASDNAKWNCINVTGRGSSPLAFVNLRNDTKGLVVQ